jgi:hypothetical protein
MHRKQYPKAIIKKYWIHQLNPLSSFKEVTNIGGSDDVNYAIRRCRKKAQEAIGKNYILLFRVVEHRGEVIYLALVNFDTFEEWDMRDATESEASA